MKKSAFSENVDDGLLIRSWQQGNEQSFEQLFYRYLSPVLKYINGILFDRAIAEEIVMDVMMAVWRRKEHIDWRIPIRHLLMRSARNRLIDYLRRKERVPEVPLSDGSSHNFSFSVINDVDESIFSKEMEEMYQRRLRALAPKRQKVFRMSREFDMSYSEIAETMSLSRNTVENHIVLALKEFRRHFKDSPFREYVQGEMLCGRKKSSPRIPGKMT